MGMKSYTIKIQNYISIVRSVCAQFGCQHSTGKVKADGIGLWLCVT